MIDKVDDERIYQHVLKLEGIRHVAIDPEFLEVSADYIKAQLLSCGAEVSEHKMNFDGIPHVFRNIEGCLGEKDKPELLITSHYDTVDNTPGANDNASAVAVMLEVARILSTLKIEDYCIRFVSFTLEELHPAEYLKKQKRLKSLNMIDKRNRYVSLSTRTNMRAFASKFTKSLRKGKSFADSAKAAHAAIQSEIDDAVDEYLEMLVEDLSKIENISDWIGKTGLVGSATWVEKAVQENRTIRGVLNLETIGFTAKQRGSQRMPSLIFKLFLRYKVRLNADIGNYITFIGERKSRFLCRSFAKACRTAGIALPYMNISLPVGFETVARKAMDLLRSDHAPFWRQGIPAIMITDTANFRYPYYHTPADTIDKLDFDFLSKICKATIISALDLSGHG